MEDDGLCPNRTRCPLYPQFQSANILRIFQRTYCDTKIQWKKCKRYEMAARGVRPPDRLLPTGDMLDPPAA